MKSIGFARGITTSDKYYVKRDYHLLSIGEQTMSSTITITITTRAIIITAVTTTTTTITFSFEKRVK